MECLKENCIHHDVCALYTFSGFASEECAFYEHRPHGSWEGKPERKQLITRRCTACGERGAVGNFCWWCGADMRKKDGDVN